MEKYRDIMGRINYGFFIAVVALLPFPQLPLRYACAAWLITWFFELRWIGISNFKFQISNLKSAIPFLLFGLWYGWRLLSGLWAADHAAWSEQMERYICFGVLIPVGLWGVNKYYDWRQVGKVLIGSCIAAIPFYLILLATLSYHRDLVNTYPILSHPLWNFWPTNWYEFYIDNVSLFKQRIALISIELMGAIMAFFLYRDRWRVLVPLEVILLSFVALSGSRQAMLTCIFLVVGMLLMILPQAYRRTYGVGILTAGVLIGGALLLLHPRMQPSYWERPEALWEIDETHDPRTNIWKLAWKQPSDYMAHGLGAGQNTGYLMERYKEHHLYIYVVMHFHCHNQYLEELMELGIGGLLLFLLGWASIPLCAKGIGKQTALLFCLMMLLNMLTDCIFSTFCGVALWVVSLILIRLQSDRAGE